MVIRVIFTVMILLSTIGTARDWAYSETDKTPPTFMDALSKGVLNGVLIYGLWMWTQHDMAT